MKQKKKKILVSIVIIFLLLSVSYSATKRQKCDKTLLVKVEKVKKSSVKKYKKYKGEFVFETVAVNSPVEGVITDIKVSEGDFVSKGAVLIVVNDNLSEKIKNIQAEIDKWKRILKKRKMWKVRSQRAEAQAEKKIKDATALLEKTKAEAEKYSIKASVNGKIKTIKVNVGDSIKIGDSVVDMVSKENLFSELRIDESNKQMFEENKIIKVKNIKTGEFYDVKIKTVLNDSVILWLENGNNQVNEPFDYCFKMFEKEYKDYLILPENIVKEDNKGKFVYVLREKKTLLGIVKKLLAKKQYIKVLDKVGEKYILDKVSGINTNDYIIISGVMAGKTVPAAKCSCLRNGILVKLLQKGEKIKIKKQKKVKAKRVVKKVKPIKKGKEVKPVREEKKIKPIKKEEKKIKQTKLEKEKTEKKEIKKAPSHKIIKKKVEKENPFLTYVKNNKLLINYDKIKTYHNYPNEFVVRVLGKNLDTDRLIKYINTINYKRFCISKSKDYQVFSAYFIEKAKKGKRVKEFKEEKATKRKAILGKIKLSIGLVASYFHISDKDFATLYKSSKIVPGIELDIKVSERIHLWGSVKKYKDDSFTTYYKKPTTFTIYPNNLGVRYVVYKNGIFSPYIGVSGDFFSYKEMIEENVTVSSNKVGFSFDIGTFFHFGDLKYIIGNLYARYNFVKDNKNGKNFDMSGLEAVLGILFRF